MHATVMRCQFCAAPLSSCARKRAIPKAASVRIEGAHPVLVGNSVSRTEDRGAGNQPGSDNWSLISDYVSKSARQSTGPDN